MGKISWRRFATLVLGGLLIAAPAMAQDATRSVPQSRAEMQLSFAPIVAKVSPAVVNIYTKRVREVARSPFLDDPFFRRFFGDAAPFNAPRQRVEQSLGSGVIVQSDGIIVTNHHVIEGAEQITVALADRREFEAKLLASDPRSDLAVLKIDPPRGETLPYIEIRNSDEILVGDLVLAIGNPFGVGQTVTSGIVSALGRTGVGGLDTQSFIQTDAAINPGNSGGALVTMDGRLIGINTAIFSRSGGSVGIGFAIPSNLVTTTVASAASGQGIVRPWFGASGQTVTADIAQGLGLARPQGVLISSVYPGGPADQAGLRVNDVVLRMDNAEVTDLRGLQFRIASRPVGQSLQIDILRNGRTQSLSMPLQRPPENPPRRLTELRQGPLGGATVGNLSPAFAEEIGLPPETRGVIVTEVNRRAAAGQLGIRPGDILLRVNATEIQSVEDASRSMTRAPGNGQWEIQIRRGEDVLTARVRG